MHGSGTYKAVSKFVFCLGDVSLREKFQKLELKIALKFLALEFTQPAYSHCI